MRKTPKTCAWLQGDSVPGLPESHDLGPAGMVCGCGGACQRHQVECGPRPTWEGRRLQPLSEGIVMMRIVTALVTMAL